MKYEVKSMFFNFAFVFLGFFIFQQEPFRVEIVRFGGGVVNVWLAKGGGALKSRTTFSKIERNPLYA